MSLRDLARRYGVSAQAVQRWLIAGGIERRPPGAPRARGVEDPVALYVAGRSAPAIAERLGCWPSTIYRRLDAAGVARRTVEPSISRRELIDALETGMAAPAIAARAGVSVSCVCRALRRRPSVARAFPADVLCALRGQSAAREPSFWREGGCESWVLSGVRSAG